MNMFFVNSSKYLLSDSDYALRLSQNLPIKGYYKKGTYSEQQNISQGVLQNIDDYRVYGYAKVIPDLEMGTYFLQLTNNTSVYKARFVKM
jgi:hypothetical protein